MRTMTRMTAATGLALGLLCGTIGLATAQEAPVSGPAQPAPAGDVPDDNADFSHALSFENAQLNTNVPVITPGGAPVVGPITELGE